MSQITVSNIYYENMCIFSQPTTVFIMFVILLELYWKTCRQF